MYRNIKHYYRTHVVMIRVHDRSWRLILDRVIQQTIVLVSGAFRQCSASMSKCKERRVGFVWSVQVLPVKCLFSDL